MRVSSISFADIDLVCDYIPVVSSFTNIFIIAHKILGSSENQHPRNLSEFNIHLADKSYLRSCVLLVPVIGNVIVAVYDFATRNYKKKEFLVSALKDFTKKYGSDVFHYQFPLNHTSKSLLRDREFLIELIRINPDVIRFTHPDLLEVGIRRQPLFFDNRDLILEVCKKCDRNPGFPYSNSIMDVLDNLITWPLRIRIPESWLSDRVMASILLRVNCKIYPRLDSNLRQDHTFLLEHFKSIGTPLLNEYVLNETKMCSHLHIDISRRKELFDFPSEALNDDWVLYLRRRYPFFKDIFTAVILKYVKEDGLLLEKIWPRDLLISEEIARAAFNQNPDAIKFAPAHLRKIISPSIPQGPLPASFNRELFKDFLFMLRAVEEERLNMIYADETLWQNLHFCLHALITVKEEFFQDLFTDEEKISAGTLLSKEEIQQIVNKLRNIDEVFEDLTLSHPRCIQFASPNLIGDLSRLILFCQKIIVNRYSGNKKPYSPTALMDKLTGGLFCWYEGNDFRKQAEAEEYFSQFLEGLRASKLACPLLDALDDHRFMLEWARSTPSTSLLASQRLRDSEDFMNAGMAVNPTLLMYASNRLKNDKAFIIKQFEQYGFNFFYPREFQPGCIRPQFKKLEREINPSEFFHFQVPTEDIWIDLNFLGNELQTDNFISQLLDIAIVKELKLNGMLLQHIPKNEQTFKMIQVAYEQNSAALQFIDPQLQKEWTEGLPAAKLFALTLFLCDNYLSNETQNESVDLTAQRFFNIIKRLPLELQRDICKKAYRYHEKTVVSSQTEELAFKLIAATFSY